MQAALDTIIGLACLTVLLVRRMPAASSQIMQSNEKDIYSVETKIHGNALILMRDISNLACLQSPNQELIDENAYLREKLVAMEDAAKRKQELFQTLLGASTIGYWEWDEIKNRPAYFSREMADIVGVSLDSLYEIYQCEEDFFPFVHPDDLNDYIDSLAVIPNPEHPHGYPHIFEYRIVRPKDEMRYVRQLKYATRVEDGVITRSFGALQDITEQKFAAQHQPESRGSLELEVAERTQQQTDIVNRLKQEIKEREKISSELEIKNAELERFAYTVSHDLKTPLVTIKGFIGLLSKDIESNDKHRIEVDFEKINSAADTMAALLTDLLELSRVGRVMGNPKICNLTEIAQQAVELVKVNIDALGIEIEIENMPNVYADELRLVEVYLNLIENSVKFMGDQISPRIHIGCGEKDGMICSFVRDNGIGIDERYHDQIFRLFERLSAEVVGTGVGLTLVKRIIEVHGGEIWVESDGLGHGSNVAFTLPKTP